MKQLLFSVVGAALLVLALQREGEHRATGFLEVGQPLPAATAISTAQPHTEVDIPSLVDRPTVIDVWQSWCEPCLLSLRPLEAFADSVGPEHLRVVYLTMNAIDDTARIADFLARSRVHHPPPVYSILNSSASDRYLIRGAPFIMVLDRRGRVRWREHGPTFTVDGKPQLWSTTMDTLRAVLREDAVR